MADTLLVTGGAATAAIAPELSRKYDLCMLYPQAAQALSGQGLKNISAIAQYADSDASEKAAGAAVALAAKVVNRMPEIEQRLAQAYSDRPIQLAGQFPDWFPGYVHSRISPMVLALIALGRLSEQKKVVGCVVHEDVTLDTRVAVNWCKVRGIPTIHIPHAACHLLPGVVDIHRETRTDFIAASGAYMDEFYRESGFMGGMEETGLVQMDWLYSKDRPSRDEARRILHIEPDKFVLVYASTWPQTTSLRSRFGAELQETLAAVLETVKELDALLAVKIHPSEGEGAEKNYEQALKSAGAKGLITRHHNSYIIPAADVVIMHGPSNLALEAAAVGVPSCYVQTEGFDFRHELPFRGSSAMLRAMVQQARDSTGDSKWQDFLRYYNAAHPDGGATKRTAEYVDRCLNTH